MNEIFRRVSTREFTDKPVSQDYLIAILKAGMQAPSAGNQQPWEFLVVTDNNLLKKLADVSLHSKPLETATAAIIVLQKSDDHLKLPYCKTQDLSACSQNILLAATALNLGVVWLGVEPFEEKKAFIKELFNLPNSVSAFNIICLGHPKNPKEATSRFDETRIHFNAY